MKNLIVSFVAFFLCLFTPYCLALNSQAQSDFNRALSLERSGNIASAHTIMARLSKANSANKHLRLAYGRILVKAQQAHKAITVLTPLATANNRNWQVWFYLGSAHLLANNLAQASYYLDEALAREGTQVSIWLNRAVVEQARGKPQASLNLLRVAADQAPNNPAVLLNRAYAYETLQQWEQALQNYRAFLQASAALSHYARMRADVLPRISALSDLSQ